jgi:hypothetical protein
MFVQPAMEYVAEVFGGVSSYEHVVCDVLYGLLHVFYSIYLSLYTDELAYKDSSWLMEGYVGFAGGIACYSETYRKIFEVEACMKFVVACVESRPRYVTDPSGCVVHLYSRP